MSYASDALEAFLRGHGLDEGYGHVFIRYDEHLVPFGSLRETIREAGADVLETHRLHEGPGAERSVLLRLSAPDVRLIVLRLARHRLIEVEGYNGKTRVSTEGK